MSLKIYQKKRKFGQTPEPLGKVSKNKKGPLRFVVQMHDASRLHFDFRLEFGGVFKSWAVPKGPSLNPLDQRLAVFVEDHPLDYGSFEGIIPKGNYGAGTVMVWDEGNYLERGSEDRAASEKAMLANFEKGHLTFVLTGQKLNGEFALIKLKKDPGGKSWLMVKKRDEFATFKRSAVPSNLSVKSGRTLEEIAAQSLDHGNVWLPQKKNKLVPLRSEPASTAAPSAPPRKPPASSEIADPMPRKIKPMLHTSSRLSVEGKNWVFEKELGGIRALAELDNNRVHLYSRSGLPFEKKFPQLVDELKTWGTQALLDGEIVGTGKNARYHVFDILYFGGRDLRKTSLQERLKVLARAFQVGPHLRRSLIYPKTDESSARWTARQSESLYHSGTSSDWIVFDFGAELQTKTPAKMRPKLSEKKLEKILEKISTRSPRSKISPHGPATAPPKAKRTPLIKSSLEEVRLTHLDKIFWPEERLTKGDLVDYYRKIAPFILPYLKDRPESLNRQPNGIAAPGFYQKDMTGHIPRWLKTTRIFSESGAKSIDYVLCQDERSLLHLINLGCIELNPWFSRVGSLEKPDFLVIDLDPDDNDFDHVIEVAGEVHRILDKSGAPNFCKTSGATGIHIGVPTGARYSFDEVRDFAENVCRAVAKKFPATTSLERNPNRRRKKIYLDFMQNRRGQTLAAPFCVRPKPGAPVSMPLEWGELKPGLRPSDFTIENAPRRISTFRDPWKGILKEGLDLGACLKALHKHFF